MQFYVFWNQYLQPKKLEKIPCHWKQSKNWVSNVLEHAFKEEIS